jgi:DNA repair photolyase
MSHGKTSNEMKRKLHMEQIAIKTTCTGTREWSDVSHNIGSGCSHGCLYCYAASYALWKGYIKTHAEWLVEKLTPRRIPTKQGVVMFPTAHDISPFYLEASIAAIQQMLEAGKSVVIVTKAHPACIKTICARFTDYRNKIILRVTIGSMDEAVCKFWEPGAPPPSERLEALRFAIEIGYTTSVSMEPMLIGVKDAIATYEQVEQYVNEKIWIGKMNSPDTRVDMSIAENRRHVAYVKACQSDKEILKLYDKLKDRSKVEWKDSIKAVVGFE